MSVRSGFDGFILRRSRMVRVDLRTDLAVGTAPSRGAEVPPVSPLLSRVGILNRNHRTPPEITEIMSSPDVVRPSPPRASPQPAVRYLTPPNHIPFPQPLSFGSRDVDVPPPFPTMTDQASGRQRRNESRRPHGQRLTALNPHIPRDTPG